MVVYFHSPDGTWGAFSNFAPFGFEFQGVYWPTAEHFFQAQKFKGTEYAKRIRKARTPREAAALGRNRDCELRPDWEEVKVCVMRQAVLMKFQAHAKLRELLLATGDEEIVESPGDPFWGSGADGRGANMLGRILMDVRGVLCGDPDRSEP